MKETRPWKSQKKKDKRERRPQRGWTPKTRDELNEKIDEFLNRGRKIKRVTIINEPVPDNYQGVDEFLLGL